MINKAMFFISATLFLCSCAPVVKPNQPLKICSEINGSDEWVIDAKTTEITKVSGQYAMKFIDVLTGEQRFFLESDMVRYKCIVYQEQPK